MFLVNSLIDIIPIVSYVLTVLGYLPEIYALIYQLIYKKKVNINVNNSIWVIWITSGILYIIYASITNQVVFIISNMITVLFCLIVFILRKCQPVELIDPSKLSEPDIEFGISGV